MAFGKREKKSPHRVDGRGGGYGLVAHALYDSPARRALSLRAECLLMLFVRRFNGFNNGRIAMSRRQIAEGLGNQNHAANQRALNELIEHGFIVKTREHPKCSRLATEYRLTFASYGAENSTIPATNEYLSWRPTNRKGKQTCVEYASPDKAVSGDDASPDWKRSGEPYSPDNLETPHVSVGASGDPASTHILTSSTRLAAPPVDAVKSRETRRAAKSDPLPHEDSFMQADELRAWVAEKIEGIPGAQSRLALEAKVPGGTLSKFLSGRGLSRHHRVSVQQALPRVVPAERMKRASNG